MKTGTKSILFGVHCFFIHPFTVALGWYKLYGFKKVIDYYVGEISLFNWKLWLCFFIHDLGYWGMSNMDDEEGESHPYWAGKIMTKVAGKNWGDFCTYHSRFLSKRDNTTYSLLCPADKMSVIFEPWWLYIPKATLSGEIKEYMRDAVKGASGVGKYAGEQHAVKEYKNKRDWFLRLQKYMRSWAYENKDNINIKKNNNNGRTVNSTSYSRT